MTVPVRSSAPSRRPIRPLASAEKYGATTLRPSTFAALSAKESRAVELGHRRGRGGRMAADSRSPARRSRRAAARRSRPRSCSCRQPADDRAEPPAAAGEVGGDGRRAGHARRQAERRRRLGEVEAGRAHLRIVIGPRRRRPIGDREIAREAAAVEGGLGEADLQPRTRAARRWRGFAETSPPTAPTSADRRMSAVRSCNQSVSISTSRQSRPVRRRSDSPAK